MSSMRRITVATSQWQLLVTCLWLCPSALATVSYRFNEWVDHCRLATKRTSVSNLARGEVDSAPRRLTSTSLPPFAVQHAFSLPNQSWLSSHHLLFSKNASMSRSMLIHSFVPHRATAPVCSSQHTVILPYEVRRIRTYQIGRQWQREGLVLCKFSCVFYKQDAML